MSNLHLLNPIREYVTIFYFWNTGKRLDFAGGYNFRAVTLFYLKFRILHLG